MSRFMLIFCALVGAFTSATHSVAATRDVDYERLARSLNQLEGDAKLGAYATNDIARARTALAMLEEDGKGKKRAHLLYMAERRVDIAWATAQVFDHQDQQAALQREHDRLQLAAARFDAEQARRELDQQRLQAQIRAEEAESSAVNAEQSRLLGEQETAYAREEAEQSRRVAEAQAQETALARKEAELAGAAADALRTRLDNQGATRGSRGMQMTLEDVAFGSGQSKLRPQANESLTELAEFVRQDPGKTIRIEGHTDSVGSANSNQVLSQERANAVRDALVALGIEASRMSAVGIGSERPIASNDTAEGRAENRRVDIILEEKQ